MRRSWSNLWLTLVVLGFAVPGEISLAQNESQSVPPALTAPAVRPLLYYFEHRALRDAALEYDPDIQALIASPRQAGEPILRMFIKASMQAPRDGEIPSIEELQSEIATYMRQIGFDTINRGGYTIHLMRMPPPEYPLEAYFIAIVYKDDEPRETFNPGPSTRYITYDRTAVQGQVFALGEWNLDREYKAYGFGDQEPTLQGFVGDVFAMLGITEQE